MTASFGIEKGETYVYEGREVEVVGICELAREGLPGVWEGPGVLPSVIFRERGASEMRVALSSVFSSKASRCDFVVTPTMTGARACEVAVDALAAAQAVHGAERPSPEYWGRVLEAAATLADSFVLLHYEHRSVPPHVREVLKAFAMHVQVMFWSATTMRQPPKGS